MTLGEYLSRDHERLDALLSKALREDGPIDETSYAEFRRGLLRHIGIEERILFPLLREHSASTGVEDQLHRDHALLSALLVPPPAREEIEQIRTILIEHNKLEEGDGGMYSRVELFAPDAVDRARAFPEVPVAPYSDTPLLRETIARLLREAGRRA